MTTTEQMLTPPQVARMLGVETYDVLILMDSGELPRVKADDGLAYVPSEAVESYCLKH